MTTDEAREAAWREWWDLVVGDDEPGEDTHDPHFNFMGGWDARGQHDAQQIAALVALLERAMYILDDAAPYISDHVAIYDAATTLVDEIWDATHARALAGQSEEAMGG